MSKLITNERLVQAYAVYSSGISIKKVAEAFHIGESTLRNEFKSIGFTLRERKPILTNHQLKEIYDLNKAGMSIRRIADIYSTTILTIKNGLKKLEIAGQKQKIKKLCIYCGIEFSDRETKHCNTCAEKRNTIQLGRLARKKTNGICIQCGKKSNAGIRCRSCADKLNTKRRNRNSMKQALIKRNNTFIPEQFIRVIFKPVGKPPELKVIQNSVETIQENIRGHVEEVILPTGEILLLNDEGLIKGLPFNFTIEHHCIRGDVFIVGKDGFYYNSLSEDNTKKWLALFNNEAGEEARSK